MERYNVYCKGILIGVYEKNYKNVKYIANKKNIEKLEEKGICLFQFLKKNYNGKGFKFFDDRINDSKKGEGQIIGYCTDSITLFELDENGNEIKYTGNPEEYQNKKIQEQIDNEGYDIIISQRKEKFISLFKKLLKRKNIKYDDNLQLESYIIIMQMSYIKLTKELKKLDECIKNSKENQIEVIKELDKIYDEIYEKCKYHFI